MEIHKCLEYLLSIKYSGIMRSYFLPQLHKMPPYRSDLRLLQTLEDRILILFSVLFCR